MSLNIGCDVITWQTILQCREDVDLRPQRLARAERAGQTTAASASSPALAPLHRAEPVAQTLFSEVFFMETQILPKLEHLTFFPAELGLLGRC